MDSAQQLDGAVDAALPGPALLRAWRDRTGRTTRDVASEVGVRSTSITEWEHGRKAPSLPSALRLATASDGAVPVWAWLAAEGDRREARAVLLRLARREARTGGADPLAAAG